VSEPPSTIVPLSAVDSATLCDYDRRHFAADRSRFLTAWLDMPNGVGLAYIDRGELLGYGVIRQCRVGFKVGPLFARDAVVAGTLYDALTGQATAGDHVFLDVPEKNLAAVQLAQDSNMEKVFETARMYTRDEPQIHLGEQFGVTSFELG
jgi:hypothetical protein